MPVLLLLELTLVLYTLNALDALLLPHLTDESPPQLALQLDDDTDWAADMLLAHVHVLPVDSAE
jgi:hypothetical protein